MTTTQRAERISKDEAITALRRAAWTQDAPAEDCVDAVTAVRDLCSRVPEGERLEPADVLALIDETVAAPRERIHCLLGDYGADWDLDAAIELVRAASDIGWLPDFMGHDLAVKANGKVYRFEARKPEETL